MAVRFERTIAGDVAYLDSRRDGAVLMWEKGTTVKFAFNRAGSSWTRIEEPGRFGGTPQTSAQFRRFAQRFAEQGERVGLGEPRRRTPRTTSQRWAEVHAAEAAGHPIKHPRRHVFER
jgi:hypothetical protein